MAANKYSLEDIKKSYKKKDAWWTVYVVDPVASRIMLPLANYTNITPNQLTLLAFLTGLAAAFQFYQGTYYSLVIGAILYHISFMLDCMDGKISRLKRTGTNFGGWLDYILDRTRVAICAFSLMLGQYLQTGQVIYFYFAAIICFLDSTRYMNSLLVYKSLNEMRKKIRSAEKTLMIEKKRAMNPHFKLIKNLNGSQSLRYKKSNEDTWVKNQFLGEVITRFPSYLKLRAFFLKRRVRLHLMSGIEYQMFIFIIAPVIGYLREGIILSTIIMIIFESAIIYKLWLQNLDFHRQLNTLNEKINSYKS
ncbi:CDP-alcohol phosphatidyltransferase family protein [Peribacillus saganii]|uniref:CDP-alcohol phosphatidyltransferase family protein n=1 Tax=Peribacillus saganii TaxID=2303992 RepID=A0A372LPY5_9BACI|nr:CDP-alcohol phosphatidyltransferase family protein [Peribacillus saganii]RFU68735.1 CDP-alcohol phosphatidyltransferase family protein [Peribacillus saganii]